MNNYKLPEITPLEKEICENGNLDFGIQFLNDFRILEVNNQNETLMGVSKDAISLIMTTIQKITVKLREGLKKGDEEKEVFIRLFEAFNNDLDLYAGFGKNTMHGIKYWKNNFRNTVENTIQ